MSYKKNYNAVIDLANIIIENANHKELNGTNLFQQNTLNLTESALQVALTNLVVDLSLLP